MPRKNSPPSSPDPKPTAINSRWSRIGVISLLLVVVTVSAYWGVGRCGFVNLDDDAYVEFQPMVNQGLRPPAMLWALTAVHSSNWHPLTSLSHMLDCDLFGLKPGPMHWENLGWHTLNVLLVFLVWSALSGATWRSALVAALFALHPLHVESVAWISERKDVLHTFFWLLGMGAYCAYVRRPSWGRYALVGLSLVLALLAKPMAVTFPCTLLLLDLWPLRRWPEKGWFTLLREKLLLFGLVVGHSVATYVAQRSSGAADFGQRFTLGQRLGNAAVAYARYLGKTFWPDSLAPFYPHPGDWPLWIVVGSLGGLVAISLFACLTVRPHRWFAFGWFWFLGTLVPVIGLAQVGAQSMADRYTYLPLLGVFTALAWAAAGVAARWPRGRTTLIAGSTAAVAACWLLTLHQVSAWQNNFTLYERSIAVGQDNATIRYLLGVATQAAGHPEAKAVAHYRRALEFEPDYINASTQLALLALAHGRLDDGLHLLEENVRLQPNNPAAHSNLGSIYARQKRYDEARLQFAAALRLDADHAPSHRELAVMAARENQLDEARDHLAIVARASPWDPQLLCELGTVEANLRRLDAARAHLERALWIKPDFPAARTNLNAVLQLMAQKS